MEQAAPADTIAGMIQVFRRPTLLAALLLGALLWPAGGCSFDRNWRRLTRTPTQDGGLSGQWVGTWKSEHSNHSGQLRAIITPVDDATYRANFDATYLGILRFGYSMNLAAQEEGDVIRFQGEENLGWIAGGLYRYDGTTDGQTFDCTYQSKSDHGRFQMTRPAGKAKPVATAGASAAPKFFPVTACPLVGTIR